MTDLRNVIKRVRKVGKKVVIGDPVDERLSDIQEAMAMDALFQSQVGIIRDRNFKLAQETRQRNIEMRQAERDRQTEIEESRLKNLKKARKVLAKMREDEA